VRLPVAATLTVALASTEALTGALAHAVSATLTLGIRAHPALALTLTAAPRHLASTALALSLPERLAPALTLTAAPRHLASTALALPLPERLALALAGALTDAIPAVLAATLVHAITSALSRTLRVSPHPALSGAKVIAYAILIGVFKAGTLSATYGPASTGSQIIADTVVVGVFKSGTLASPSSTAPASTDIVADTVLIGILKPGTLPAPGIPAGATALAWLPGSGCGIIRIRRRGSLVLRLGRRVVRLSHHRPHCQRHRCNSGHDCSRHPRFPQHNTPSFLTLGALGTGPSIQRPRSPKSQLNFRLDRGKRHASVFPRFLAQNTAIQTRSPLQLCKLCRMEPSPAPAPPIPSV